MLQTRRRTVEVITVAAYLAEVVRYAMTCSATEHGAQQLSVRSGVESERGQTDGRTAAGLQGLRIAAWLGRRQSSSPASRDWLRGMR